ncbi:MULTISPECIES: hypothetical protein [unclassified Mesorhizobium]|uniref:hypothetical protein n=1 Tax=unclassified Mesorhizobium TaxID=325217 RepID=UPI000FD529DF|nr:MULTISPECIES: hypothetical protein [unclassified Mesorhizobium]RUV82464.1 hypothetical protein EOA88_18595 [Mesorhizobium sp. M5C.F.Ca.IN.020.14.1.1]RUV31683.1 hypothetical protein EOA86_05635 [Mesorhizobium sp. M5C.F.Ca.IN.020.32.2.1]RWG51828.1 MAG: hypothetical protein EOQ62_00765 [Mesorhizobium sp.]RWH51089.1 MAG: hypothetical protein EOQ80_01735 [Mesorhizobium sp.]RWH59094.1 MAG: hypothetical protein EOQ82_04420 [Mesorhizobium sp.]
MTSFYHGSYIRYVIGGLGLQLRRYTKAVRALYTGSKPRSVLEQQAKVDALIVRRDWTGLEASTNEMAIMADRVRDPELMQKAGQAFERLGNFARAAELRLSARRQRKGKAANEWTGEDLGSDTLLIDLVEDDPRSLGRVIRHARLAGAAAGCAQSATIRVEPRLVSLVQRTFPNATVVPAQQNVVGDKFATFENLAWVFGRDAERLAADFVPLRVDPELVQTFRKRYRSMTDLPLVGLSWGSKSHTKDVPDFPEWARFIAQTHATFVSLQYGQIKPALRRLRNGNDARLIYDDSVDQMVDMDRFAAQIAALDAVVTISNTAAHLSGALGVPTIFLIDDKFQTAWPVIGDRTPWYPKGLVIRKEGRAWSVVLDDVGRRLSSILTVRSTPPRDS